MPKPTPPPKYIREEYRRALRLLAGSPDGCTEALMLAHGFAPGLLVELCRGGLATVKVERMRRGSRMLDITWVRITERGRALMEMK